ncbi:MAG: type II secretion system protein [Clostridia bacterium]
MKNTFKNGFSLIALGATVTIMVILLTTVVISGVNTSNTAKKLAFGTEIDSLQTSVDAYADKNDAIYPTLNSIIVDVSHLSAFSKSQFEVNEGAIQGQKVLLYEIDYEKINVGGLKYGNKKDGANDIYCVSAKSGKVYYAKGLKIGTNMYFTMTEELTNLLNYNKDKNVRLSGTPIIFEPSKTEWTSTNVSVKVKIPVSCTVLSVTSNGETILRDSAASNATYNIYNATTVGNYTIVVKYKESATSTEEKAATYAVTNVDTESPILTLDTKNMKSSENNNENIIGYIKINSKTDNISGIKMIKYETDKVEKSIYDYFQKGGIEVKNDIISIPKGTRNVTVYIQDRAGNYRVYTVQVSDTMSAQNYVKDGLILLLDAQNNTGNGHGTNITTWKDLSGNGNDGLLTGFNFNASSGWDTDSLTFDGVDDIVSTVKNLDYKNSKAMSVEFVVAPLTDKEQLIIESSDNSNNYYGAYYINTKEFSGVDDITLAMKFNNPTEGRVINHKRVQGIYALNKFGSYSTSFDSERVYNKYISISFNGNEKECEGLGNSSSNNFENNVSRRLLGNYKLYIGGRGLTTNPLYSNIKVKSIRVYNKTLTQQQIKANYDVDNQRFGI